MMNQYYEFTTEDETRRIFDFSYLQHLMKESAKAKILYRAAVWRRSCDCYPFERSILNGIYGHEVYNG